MPVQVEIRVDRSERNLGGEYWNAVPGGDQVSIRRPLFGDSQNSNRALRAVSAQASVPSAQESSTRIARPVTSCNLNT